MRPSFSSQVLLPLLPTICSISIPNFIPTGGILSLDNVSHVSSTSTAANLSDPRFLPYTYKVPFTDMTLHLGFGVFQREPLDGMEMDRLIHRAQKMVDGYIQRVGPDHEVPTGPDKIQQWTYWMASGNAPLEISIQSWEAAADKKFTWGQIAVVLEGLRLYLIDGKRFWVTTFNFMEGKPFFKPGLLGGGFLRRSGWQVTSS